MTVVFSLHMYHYCHLQVHVCNMKTKIMLKIKHWRYIYNVLCILLELNYILIRLDTELNSAVASINTITFKSPYCASLLTLRGPNLQKWPNRRSINWFFRFCCRKNVYLKKTFLFQYCNLNSTLPAETEHKIPITSPKVILVTINSFKKLGYIIFIFG